MGDYEEYVGLLTVQLQSYQTTTLSGIKRQKNESAYILPFHLPFDKSSATCMSAPTMDFPHDTLIYNNGKMDGWCSARDPDFGMSYFSRSDLPYYYALADEFTIGDHYFQSSFTATNPNRQHLFTGSNGLSVTDGEYIMMDDTEPVEGLPWETMAETLTDAGVSWKVFQEQDNFDDNAFAWFTSFHNAKPGDNLYDNGLFRSDDVVEQFASYVRNDSLPQVSWIVGPTALSEHANNHPQDGEDFSARILKVLGDPNNAAVFAKTALILNYDEGGQFFDHLWSPVPPKNDADGVSTVTTKGEITTKEVNGVAAGHQIGPAFRVPFFAISPWSRGGYVYSEHSDHTSVIKFVEKRFNVRCPNISPYRRAMMSDLTWAFDFSAPDFSPWPVFPNTSANVNTSKAECANLPAPQLPSEQSMPQQEPGFRPSRRLPYEIDVFATLSSEVLTAYSLHLTITNNGNAGTVLIMYDRVYPHNNPRKYAVEAGMTVNDVVQLQGDAAEYGFSIHAANGFVRQFGGPVTAPTTSTRMRYDVANKAVVFVMAAAVNKTGQFVITDNAYGARSVTVTVTENQVVPSQQTFPINKSGCWYDFSVAESGSSQIWRYMGRMETADDSISDPAVMKDGRATVTLPAVGYSVGLEGSDAYGPHQPVPSHYEVPRWQLARECASLSDRKTLKWKDACASVYGHAKLEL